MKRFVRCANGPAKLRTPRLGFAFGARALSLAFTAVTMTACVTSEDQTPTDLECPSEENFAPVSQVLERRCGTLDCHGSVSRPLRLVGRNGTRLSDKDRVGDEPTTESEREANRLGVCAFSPEEMADAMAREAVAPSDLTVLRKPLLLEAHKGGQVWTENAPGLKCVLTWIEGDVDVAECHKELQIP